MPITAIHDGLLTISVGHHRYDTKWKHTEISWSDLLQRLSKTTVTAETHSEYMDAPKGRQDEIKDVGGFVGGVIHGGRRKANTIQSRCLITLDIDYGDIDFWETVQLGYTEAAAIYSTHKHNAKGPRYRLVMPLSRDVFPDEYQAIARWIAGSLGIEVFDITTYQPERLMYWPSTPKDQEYYFRWQDGRWIDPDDILGRYVDWRDSTQWPVSKREKDRITAAGIKQGEPADKPGIVGAFCRIFSITDVLEGFLADIYEPTQHDDRWTYRAGSTAGGLVIYDNKFAYSHHGTDPTSGKLCNAFDLVRLHKFGGLDDSVDAHTPINKRPSHLEMEQFALRDKRVSKELVTQKLSDLNEDFKEAIAEDGGDDSWLEKLECDKKGNVLSTITNVNIILQNDPQLKNCFGYDDFKHVDTALNNLPWRTINKIGEELTDNDDSALRAFLERTYKIWSPPKVKDAFSTNRHLVTYHPIRDYFNSLKWDGLKRIEAILPDYFGTEDNDYTRCIMKKSLCAAVMRIFKPGCKFDNVLVLVGPEGTGKSTFLKLLGREWFSDSLGSIDHHRVYEQLQGAWLIEVAELNSIRRSAMEQVKHFFGKQEDRFRVAYGRRVEEFPRQCVFFGTTNEDRFLQDDNGDRRFWPVKVRPDFVSLSVFKDFPNEVDQVWAEAVELFKNGLDLELPKHIEEKALKTRKGFTQADARLELLIEYLYTPIGEMDEGTPGELRNRVSYCELWTKAFGGMRKDMNKNNTKFISKMMALLKNWRKMSETFRDTEFGVQRGFERVGVDDSEFDPSGDQFNHGLLNF